MASILKSKGIAMVTVLIFMLLVVIISGAALSIMTKQARLAENQIRRIRAFYAAESAINKAYQSLRYDDPLAPQSPPWNDIGGGVYQWIWNNFEWDPQQPGLSVPVTVTFDTTDGRLSANVDYGL